MKIKKIVVSQPEPQGVRSPYSDVAQKHGVKIDFCKFIRVDGLSSNEFRKQKIDILQHTAVIFSTQSGVDHFFRLCSETRVSVPDTMKYFCPSEAISLYLQKYIQFRKRKIFSSPDNTFASLMEQCIKRHRDENFLVVLPEGHKADIPRALDKAKIKYTKAILYKTVSSDLSDLKLSDYDMVIFFSPNGIKSLFDNWPNYEQGDMAIGAFGTTTAKAVRDAGLRLDVAAPTPKCPSMPQALDMFLTSLRRGQGDINIEDLKGLSRATKSSSVAAKDSKSTSGKTVSKSDSKKSAPAKATVTKKTATKLAAAKATAKPAAKADAKKVVGKTAASKATVTKKASTKPAVTKATAKPAAKADAKKVAAKTAASKATATKKASTKPAAAKATAKPAAKADTKKVVAKTAASKATVTKKASTKLAAAKATAKPAAKADAKKVAAKTAASKATATKKTSTKPAAAKAAAKPAAKADAKKVAAKTAASKATATKKASTKPAAAKATVNAKKVAAKTTASRGTANVDKKVGAAKK